MYVGCTHRCICITCVCVCLWMPEVNHSWRASYLVFGFFFVVVCLFWDGFFHWDLEPTRKAKPGGQGVPGITWLCLINTGIRGTSHHSWLFTWVLGIKLKFSCLHTNWAITSSVPHYLSTPSHFKCLYLFIYLGVDDCTFVEVNALAPSTTLVLRIKFRSLGLVTKASVHSVHFQPSKLLFVCVSCYLSFHTAFLKLKRGSRTFMQSSELWASPLDIRWAMGFSIRYIRRPFSAGALQCQMGCGMPKSTCSCIFI